jgi:2-polyprenyl-3-methyl-5-hydroxy-6-metoxy-1,4-benzoquinol methylase
MNKNKYPKFNKNYILKKGKKFLVKDYFSETFRLINNKYKKNSNFSLIDLGCASGFFVNYITSKFNKAETAGVDFSAPLIKEAKISNPNSKFYVKDLLKNSLSKIGKYDITTCLGTLEVFDDHSIPIKNLFSVTKKGGTIIIFTLVNKHDVNVKLRYQKNYGSDKNWYTAFNNFSKPYWIEKIKAHKKNAKIKFHKFQLKKKLARTKNDPMRSWTTSFGTVKNQITVGTAQILCYNIIEIKV